MNKNSKLKLIEFILDELKIKTFRKLVTKILLKKLSHKDLSYIVIQVIEGKGYKF
jgi:hypothetical protein